MFELGLLLPVSTNTTNTTSTSAGELKGARMCNSLVTSGLYSGLLGHRSTSQCGRPQTCKNRACTNSHLLDHTQALYILMVFHYIWVFPGLAEYFGIKYPFQHWLTNNQHAIPDEPSLNFRSLMKENEELP